MTGHFGEAARQRRTAIEPPSSTSSVASDGPCAPSSLHPETADATPSSARIHAGGEADLPVLVLDQAADDPSLAALLREHSAPRKPAVRLAACVGKRQAISVSSLLGECPDCGAPLTVREWLQVADCWRCGASVALERVVVRETIAPPKKDEQKTPVQPVAKREPQVKRELAAPAERSDKNKVKPTTAGTARKPTGVSWRSVGPPPRMLPEVEAPPLPSSAGPALMRSVREGLAWFQLLPAWLVSLLVHLLLFILLAALSFQPSRPLVESITLSTTVSTADREGEVVHRLQKRDPTRFDLPTPEWDESLDREAKEVVIQADQDARELRELPEAQLAYLPPLRELRRALESREPQRMFAARDPRLRTEMVRQEGGTTWTEAAVSRGLRWLDLHQMADGSWSLDRFSEAIECSGRCSSHGHIHSDTGATALALLPFLGAGQTHRTGRYRKTVDRGLEWLLAHQDDDGDLRHDSHGPAGMYAHGQATIVLCEAYAMTGDKRLHRAAQRAVEFIEEAQHREGGWRYQPGERGDTSVLGWQWMALQSARAAGLKVSKATLRRAGRYLDSAMSDDQIRYAYQPGERPNHVMTAESLLCRLYQGWSPEDERLRWAAEWLLVDHPPRVDDPNVYYWYYATQAMHHLGDELWDGWNLQLRDALVQSQNIYGHEAGSWDPVGPHTPEGGRLYATALAVCTLEVYYRHAPIWRNLAETVPTGEKR